MKDPIIIIEDKELLKTSFFNYFSNNIYNKINDIPVINYNDKIFIVFSYKLEFQDIQKKINKINSNFKNINFLYFVSKKIKTHFEKLDNCIFFPIKLDELTSIIKKDNDGLIVYNNVELRDNILKNLNNNKLIKISDIEKEILRILFFQKSAEKQDIKVTVLNAPI